MRKTTPELTKAEKLDVIRGKITGLQMNRQKRTKDVIKLEEALARAKADVEDYHKEERELLDEGMRMTG